MDSLGRTTCLTGTDTVGTTNFDKAGAAAAIANVDGTSASVSTAIEAINAGTLTGQVPALSLVNSLATAQDALAAYGKTAAASNPTFDTTKDGKVDATEAADALKAANAARFGDAGATTSIVGVSTKTTAQLNADVIDTAAAAAASKAALNAATGGSVALAAYDKAVADYTAATAAVTAHEAAANAATAGLETSLTATGATVSYATISALVPGTSVDGVGGIIEFLTKTTNAVQRANVVNELNKVANFGPETVKTADLAKAVVKTDAALNTSVTGATDKLLAIDIGAATSLQSTDYVTTGKAATDAAALLTKAQTADAAIAAAKAVTDQYASLTKGVADANTALTQFEAANTAKVDLHDLSAADYATSAKADVFYFAAKATAITGAIADFGTGDSIVLGSAYTQGTSLAAGDSNKVEFFLVQGSTGVQVIAETNAFGNSTTTTDASGNVLAQNDAAVITLTGVALADLTVNNGVISHVA